MNEYLMLEIARQRNAEWQESARISRLARGQRAANRAERAERGRGGKVRGVPEQGDKLVGLLPIPDYVEGTFASDRRSTPVGPTAAQR